MHRNRIVVAACLLVLFWPVALLAADASKESPWEITADRLSRFENPASIVAEGNVVMFRKDEAGQGLGVISSEDAGEDEQFQEGEGSGAGKLTTITGDWLRLDPVTNVVKVRGHAVLDSAEEHITAESATLNLENHTGVLTRATLYFPNRSLYVVGEHVEKTGELTYALEEGWLTKCEPEEGKSPPWSYAWSTGHITYEGFAHFTHARLQVKDIPVFYSPYFAFSTNGKRKTGFLMPEWGHGGREGATLLVPYFINLSPSQDLTLYAGGMQKRGPYGGAEYRYVADEESKGTFAVNFLKDSLDEKVGDDYKSDGIYRKTDNRYWVRGKIDHKFPADFYGKLDIDLISDRDFLQEFNNGLIGHETSDQSFKRTFGRGFDGTTTVVRTNTAQFSKAWPDMSLNGGMTVVHDPTDTPGNQHRWTLPSLSFSGRKPLVEKQFGATGIREFLEDIDLTWGSGYANYWQELGVSGQTVDVSPKLQAPLRLTPYLETTVAVGLQETMWQVNDKRPDSLATFDHDFHSRTLQNFNISNSTIFMRDFAFDKPSFKRLTHMIRPSVSYSYVPAKSQLDLPDFVSLVGASNSIGYGVTNDFDVFGLMSDGQLNTRKFGMFQVNQSYSILEQRRDLYGTNDKHRPYSDIAIEADVAPLENLGLGYKTNWNVYGRGIMNYQFTSRFSDNRGDAFGMEYRYETYADVNQINSYASLQLTEALSANVNLAYSLYVDEISDGSFHIFYDPGCWTLDFMANTTPEDDYRFSLVVTFEDIGKVIGFDEKLHKMDSGNWTFNKDKLNQ